MRWTFWPSRSTGPPRALPTDTGLVTPSRPPGRTTVADPDDADGQRARPSERTSGASPTPDAAVDRQAPLTAPSTAVDRRAVAAAGADLSRIVDAVLAATRERGGAAGGADGAAAVAVAATGVLAGRLPPLAGVDGAMVFDQPQDELLHAYAELLATRAATRTSTRDDRDDLLAVAHVAAAAVASDAADDPALLLLAGVPADRQLTAAAVLLAQTADDGAGGPEQLAAEVRSLWGGPG